VKYESEKGNVYSKTRHKGPERESERERERERERRVTILIWL
jgi:hypothetical protein